MMPYTIILATLTINTKKKHNDDTEKAQML